jgi:hypothetical protein
VYNTFALKFENLISGEIEIKNLNGQVIIRKEIRSNEAQIDISRYPDGIYFVTVRSARWVKTGKVVKDW